MRNRNGRDRAQRKESDGFPVGLARRISADRGFLDALVALRSLGNEGAEAVDALGRTRRLASLRWSWALWEALAEGTTGDSEERLLEFLPLGTIEHARFALWGPSWRSEGPSGELAGSGAHR